MSARAVPPWTDGERQQLLDELRAGYDYRQVALMLRRSELQCRAEAAHLRAQGWGAIGAHKRRGASGLPLRKCSNCREPFEPPTRFRFRCDDCVAAGNRVWA